MFLLKWRFIKGYRPDKYGNIYDRNGILLYKTEGKFVDEQIQQEFIIDKNDQSTQINPIENVISTLKQMEIKSVYKQKKEIAVGNNLLLGENIEKSELSIKGNKKEKQNMKIDKNNNVEIKHMEKIFKDESTDINIPLVEYKIINLENINISREEYNLQKKVNSLKKNLLTQMIYKKQINEKN